MSGGRCGKLKAAWHGCGGCTRTYTPPIATSPGLPCKARLRQDGVAERDKYHTHRMRTDCMLGVLGQRYSTIIPGGEIDTLRRFLAEKDTILVAIMETHREQWKRAAMGKRLAKDLPGAVKEATRRGSEKRKYSSQRSQNRNSPAASSPSPARRNQQKRDLPSCTTVSRNAVRPAGEETQKNGSPRTVEENHLSKVQYSIFSHLFVFTFTRVAAHFYPLYVYLPGSLQILSGICTCTPWRRIFICLLPF